MTGCSSILLAVYSSAATLTTALVPHKYWNRPVSRTTTKHSNNRSNNKLCMYFDDCERLDDDDNGIASASSNIHKSNWILSYGEEKTLAMEKLLGYQPSSAAKLSDEQVEEETLRWAVDTNIVWVDEDDEEIDEHDQNNNNDQQPKQQSTTHRNAKYDSIQDLRIASNCDTVLESLAFCWSVIADALQEQQERDENMESGNSNAASSSSSSSSAQLIVFSKSAPLWDYDTMVNMLVAIQISKPFLPSQYELQLDLFHPHYKHSPRMWSPERHAPFPTLGVSIQRKKESPKNSFEEMDMDATRAKLDALFQSMDASKQVIRTTTPAMTSMDDPTTETDDDKYAQILHECMAWLASKQESSDTTNIHDDLEWTIQTIHNSQQHGAGAPFQLYKTLWNTILTLSSTVSDSDTSVSSSSSMVIVPHLDSHTLHRVAVTVNAALMRLTIPVRITQVYTHFTNGISSNNSNRNDDAAAASPPPPYGMIQLSSTGR